jgi:hypothetical protein
MGTISAEELRVLAEPLSKNGYGQYLVRVLDEKSIEHEGGEVR